MTGNDPKLNNPAMPDASMDYEGLDRDYPLCRDCQTHDALRHSYQRMCDV